MATQFQCYECGRKFRTVSAAERAVTFGCPGCGGSDIDLAIPDPIESPKKTWVINPSKPVPLTDLMGDNPF